MVEHLQIRGESVPCLGLGTWSAKGDECRRSLRTALSLGYRYIDTASQYENQRAIGDAIATSDVPREDVFLSTKLWKTDLRYNDAIATAEESLEKLRSAYVDLLLIHWPNETVPLEETISAMNQLQEEGKVRHIGVSNFSLDELLEANDLSETPLFASQMEYNVLKRYTNPIRGQEDVLSYCQENGIMFTAYTPLHHGKAAQHEVLQDIGKQYGKTGAQVALRWLVRQENISTIPKSTTETHLTQNMDIFDFELSDEDLARIDEIQN